MFIDKDTEAQRDQSAYPDSHSWALVQDSDLGPGSHIAIRVISKVCIGLGCSQQEKRSQASLSWDTPLRAVSEKEQDIHAQNGSI